MRISILIGSTAVGNFENNKDIEDQINARKSFYLGCIKKYTSVKNMIETIRRLGKYILINS